MSPMPIAVVGASCRFPSGANDLDKLWKMVWEGRDTWSDVPAERYNWKSFYHPDHEVQGAHNQRGGHYLEANIKAFDAKFFGIAAAEAVAMDPQQRLLLMATYEALENAGLRIEEIKGSNTGVYVATFTHDWNQTVMRDPLATEKYALTGVGTAILSNRISYVFDLKGPSMSIDTACSGSLVAIHQACQSLWTGETNTALVGGANLSFEPDMMLPMSLSQILNGAGKSYSFDSRGSGYGRGEGVAAIVLKRLDDALKAGDHIHGVIRNTGLNQDGKTAGITVPNGESQKQLMRSVYERAHLNPNDTVFFEAHGTGTKVGDVIEVNAIGEVFCEGPGASRDSSLYLGTIKANIGHTEGCSGLAGLLKAMLVLKHRVIPPIPNVLELKEGLLRPEWNLTIPTSTTPWPESKLRRASVNSFGYGGTNAHVILEVSDDFEQILEQCTGSRPQANGFTLQDSGHSNYKESATGEDSLRHDGNLVGMDIAPQHFHLLPLMARAEISLKDGVDNLMNWLESNKQPVDVDDLAYTLSSRRSAMPWRFSFLADSTGDLAGSLKSQPKIFDRVSPNSRLVYVFTGQGAQWFGMGRELLEVSTVFRQSILESERILALFGPSWNLAEELLRDKDSTRVSEAMIGQPVSTAVQLALVDLLCVFGLKPNAVVGHSSGEIAAAYAAGALTQEAALKISYYRGLLSSRSAAIMDVPGGMIAVGLGDQDVGPYLSKLQSGKAVVACANSPTSTTVSGDESAIAELKLRLDEASIFCRKLQVDTAYHSHHMQSVAASYLADMADIVTAVPDPSIEFISSVTGMRKISGFGAAYWVENLVSKVCFQDAIAVAAGSSRHSNLVMEIGPHHALAGPTRDTLTALGLDKSHFHCLPTLVRNRNSVHSVLESAGKLFQKGIELNWDAVNGLNGATGTKTFLTNLPPYAWDNRNEYWVEPRLNKDYLFRSHPYHELLGIRLPGTLSADPVWRHVVSRDSLSWVEHHVVDGNAIFPATGFLAMAIEAKKQITIDRLGATTSIANFVLRDVQFKKMLRIPEQRASVELLLTLKGATSRNGKATNAWEEFKVFSVTSESDWDEHCHGYVRVELEEHIDGYRSGEDAALTSSLLETFSIRKEGNYEPVTSSKLYEDMNARGNYYGPTFAVITEYNVDKHDAYGTVRLPDIAKYMPGNYMQPFVIHPGPLDAITHTCLPLFSRLSKAISVCTTGVAELTVSAKIASLPGTDLDFMVDVAMTGASTMSLDVCVFQNGGTEDKEMVIRLSGGELRALVQPGWEESQLPPLAKSIFKVEWDSDLDVSRPPLDTTIMAKSVEPSHGLQQGYEHMVQFMKRLAFKRPDMRVLEVGTGTSTTGTVTLLEVLAARQEEIPLASYDFANSSTTELDLAQSEATQFGSVINFKHLDITSDSMVRKLEAAQYDIIVASNALNEATGSGELLRNAHWLLKAGGWLLTVETSTQDSPSTARDEWNRQLKQDSFDSIAYSADDWEGNEHRCSFIASRPRFNKDKASSPVIIVTRDDCSNTHTDFASQLMTEFHNRGIQAQCDQLPLTTVTHGTLYLILDESEQPIMVQPAENLFNSAKDILIRSDRVFWVTVAHTAAGASNPGYGTTLGFTRSAREENPQVKIVSFTTVDSTVASASSDILTKIQDVADASFFRPEATISDENEFLYKAGQLLIPRLAHHDTIQDMVKRTADTNPKPVMGLLHQPGRPLALHVESPGLLDSIRFIDDERAAAPIAPHEIEIQTFAFGLNFKDVMVSLGQMKSGVPMVGEASGIVTAVGSDYKDRYKVGDRALGWVGTPYASRTRFHALNACRIPDNVSYEIGASISTTFSTAWEGLVEIGHLQKGQAVLIHAAAGGVGQAAIRIAQRIGAEIYATAGSEEKRRFLTEEFGIPRDHIFSSRNPAFKKGVMRMTRSVGVHVVLNSLSGEMLTESLSCVARFGYFIEIGKADIYAKMPVSLEAFDRSITLASVDLWLLSVHRPEHVYRVVKEVVDLLETGELAPTSIQTMPISQLEDAMRRLQSGKAMGKIILTADDNTMVKMLPAKPQPPKLNPDGTYIVSGGARGLGLEIGLWMARRGAKQIVLLSRSKPSSDFKATLESQFESLGAMVRISECDIVDEAQCKSLAHELRDTMPPIKGIVQGAAVTRDMTINAMAVEDYNHVLDPKVQGTQNLLAAFDEPSLDFVVLLSSSAGVLGARGSSSYCAGNAYLDAMANAQKSSNARVIALDLGAMKETGIIARDARLGQHFESQGFMLLTNNDLFTLMEYLISPQAAEEDCRQIVCGFSGETFQGANNASAMAKPLLRTVMWKAQGQQTDTTSGQPKDLRSLLLATEEASEALAVVTDHLTKKISGLIAVDIEVLTDDVSVESLGMDSLVLVELKSWIARDLLATLQPPEILTAANVKALASRILEKTTLLSPAADTAAEKDIDSGSTMDGTASKSSVLESTSHSEDNLSSTESLGSLALPDMPVPESNRMLERFLSTASCLGSPEELEQLRKTCGEFTEPDSDGQRLQNRLINLASSPTVDNWWAETVDTSRLGSRSSLVPFQNYMASYPLPSEGPRPSAAERAATLSMAAFKTKIALETGQVSDFTIGGTTVDLTTCDRMFSTVREPGMGSDTLRRYPDSAHMVAFSCGQAFKVELENPNWASFKATFEEVISTSAILPESAIAALTTDSRDQWAEAREYLSSFNTTNAESLSAIESAAFVVCLDDASPETEVDAARQIYWGTGTNRWHDKSLQFVVCANGASGSICEHAALDGLSTIPLVPFMEEAIGEEPMRIGASAMGDRSIAGTKGLPVKHLDMTTDLWIDNRITHVRCEAEAGWSQCNVDAFTTHKLGEKTLRAANVSPKSALTLAVLLAGSRYFGNLPSSHETVSLSAYRGGRAAGTQLALPTVQEFCDSVAEPIPRDEQQGFFYKAAATLTSNLIRSAHGDSFAPYLTALEKLAQEEGGNNQLFEDPVYRRVQQPQLTIDCLDTVTVSGGWGPQRVWVHFKAYDNGVHFSVFAHEHSATSFGKEIERAVADVSGLLKTLS